MWEGQELRCRWGVHVGSKKKKDMRMTSSQLKCVCWCANKSTNKGSWLQSGMWVEWRGNG